MVYKQKGARRIKWDEKHFVVVTEEEEEAL